RKGAAADPVFGREGGRHRQGPFHGAINGRHERRADGDAVGAWLPAGDERLVRQGRVRPKPHPARRGAPGRAELFEASRQRRRVVATFRQSQVGVDLHRSAAPTARMADSSTLPRRGLMFILSSPSGAGKTTIARKLLAAEDNLQMSVSVTTRPKRPGEVEGRDDEFTDLPGFNAMAEADAFLE